MLKEISGQPVLRRLTVITAMLVVVISAACGGGDDGNKFPEAVRKNVLSSCTSSGGSDKQCTCALDRLEKKYNLKQFEELEKRITSGDSRAEAELEPVIRECR